MHAKCHIPFLGERANVRAVILGLGQCGGLDYGEGAVGWTALANSPQGLPQVIISGDAVIIPIRGCVNREQKPLRTKGFWGGEEVFP